jgi:phosphoglucomutase/phosphomannomutase-like protein
LIGEDRRWLLVRTSGTEPLARVYAEARDPETVASLLALGQSLLRPANEGQVSPPEPPSAAREIEDAQPVAATRPRPGRSRTYTRQRGG